MTIRRGALWVAAVGVALSALVTGALWLRSDEPVTSSIVQPADADSRPPSVPERGVEGASVAPQAAAPPPAASHVSVPRATAKNLEQQFARNMYDETGRTVVDYLVGRGLARSDSEPVVRNAYTRIAECSFAALRVEAVEQSVSFDALLDAIEAILHDADGPEVSALIDVRAVQARATPCLLNVAQQAGLPLPAAELPAR